MTTVLNSKGQPVDAGDVADELISLRIKVKELKKEIRLYDIAALDFIRSNDMPVEFLGKPITHYAAYLIRTLREKS